MNNRDMFTPNQAREIGFDRTAYSFPESEESFSALLQMKIYGERCIYCYFITDDERKIRLPLWYDRNRENSFHPYQCDIDFGKVSAGTKWYITMGMNKRKRLTWFDAKPLVEDEKNEYLN